ncbi:7915_t:CDS:2 [Funneliformis geosporum]|uniref:7915_t:CDS:1 n=1 Tax=Funneliformis geosporum TaxID=1117311 RepID=A0A9W4SNN3_9GLOM|nr:7915_t:CDS:2 [Funneliformis geosporum]
METIIEGSESESSSSSSGSNDLGRSNQSDMSTSSQSLDGLGRSSENSNKSDLIINCPLCNNAFDNYYSFMLHYEAKHVHLVRRIRNQ